MPSVEQKQIVPLFKSNFSIGKSILTLDPTVDSDLQNIETYPNGPKSIFGILSEENLTELILLEDNFYSFYSAYTHCKNNKIKLIYGINFQYKEGDHLSRVSVFMKNKLGYRDLILLDAKRNEKGFLEFTDLKNLLTANLLLTIPFYDSFIHSNSMTFSKFSDALLSMSPVFFLEDNGLPFDDIIRKSVVDICGDRFELLESKTICYYKRSDIDAFLTYKCICNRSFGKKSLAKPNFDHFSSDEFCWESYKERAAKDG